METSHIRIPEDGVMRFGQALPYRWCTGATGMFPRPEADSMLL